MQSFTTQGLPTPHKVAFWNALSSETFAAMEITPRDATAFDGELLRESLGPLTLMDVRSSAVRIRHTDVHIRRAQTPSYLLLAPLQGGLLLTTGREDALAVQAGEFCLLDHARPYELEHGDAMRTLCLDIPRATLDAVMPAPMRAVGRLMRPDRAASRLLATLLRELGTDIGPGAAASFTPAFAQGLLSFVVEAYTQEPNEAPDAKQARRQSLLTRVDARLHEPTLRPADIARDVGVSERRLRAMLAETGESFSTYLRRRRLERCSNLLRDPAWRHWSITQLAFHVGFNNATHFGHAFKAHFGVTPRDWRQSMAFT